MLKLCTLINTLVCMGWPCKLSQMSLERARSVSVHLQQVLLVLYIHDIKLASSTPVSLCNTFDTCYSTLGHCGTLIKQRAMLEAYIYEVLRCA